MIIIKITIDNSVIIDNKLINSTIEALNCSIYFVYFFVLFTYYLIFIRYDFEVHFNICVLKV